MKILIIGLRNEQFLSLKKTYKHLNLHGIDSQSKHCRKISNSVEFNIIVNLTKFSSHSIHKLYKKHKGYTMINGGYSSVINYLETIQ